MTDSENDHGLPDPGLAIDPDILMVSVENMRALGYAMVDRTIAHLTHIHDIPAIRESSADDLMSAVGGPVPNEPHPLDADLALLADVVLANQQHGDHPRYFARVAGPSSFPGILADWIGTGLQSVASSWAGGAGPTAVELTVLEWLRDALGLPNDFEGILSSGGSMANITALITARHLHGDGDDRDGVVYLTDQTHASLARGLRAMGLSDEQIHVLESDEHFQMSPAALAQAITDDRTRGLTPRICIATTGTTNTGAVDDLAAIADLCTAENMWLHVDGAYGGAAALSPRGKSVIHGLDRIDSFVTDPHKWLFQPYDVACVWVRGKGALERTFAMHPEYLADLDGEYPDLHNRSLELTRRSRALKLWLTLRAYGLPTIQQAIDRGIALAEYAERVITQHPELEVVTPAQLGIITFRAIDADASAHRRSVAHLNASGFAAGSTTILRGETVFRLCIINPRTTQEDLEETINRLASYAR